MNRTIERAVPQPLLFQTNLKSVNGGVMTYAEKPSVAITARPLRKGSQ